MLFGLRRKLGRCSAWLGSVVTPGGTASDGAGAITTDTGLPVRLGEALTSVAASPDMELRVVLERSGPALVVAASGSVDASNVEVWRRLVNEAAAVTHGPGPLVIDSSGLEFMGICAFAVLVEESARCRRRGVSLRLVSSQPLVGRVVNAAGLHSELAFCVTIDEALGDTPREDPGPVRGSSA
ncbi:MULTISPECIES: anti-sigma factor antagonist [Mycolicibacter]|uniref:anti-sigma factor antagonist n=1 Tax=Mycolicibacter TaxID=1073531 RepID=UPI0002D63514|nr:anti-sigma factor antagonist [Mycolicibacter sinensis]